MMTCTNNRVIHVRAAQDITGDGSEAAPFSTIQQAAEIAQPSDRVIVHDGTYREEVNPACGGLHEYAPISYEAAPGEHPVIKGSEIVANWERLDGGVWHVAITNTLFGSYNPFAQTLDGDWLEQPHTWKLSLGDVYLNGRSMYEARSIKDVYEAKIRETAPGPMWIDPVERLLHPEDSIYQWHAEVHEKTTEIWANFHEAEPNKELVEINVRRSCFYPSRTGLNHIIVRGFEMAQAACGWAPPTANQIGLIGMNWAKDWIIEDNIIHDAKCSGISLGKEYSTGDQELYSMRCKPGYQRQLESTFLAKQRGWSKETIGSHIVRNNEIFDCGQNGIVGNLGCIFSTIENNRIHDIGTKHEFFGHEIAGIKLHAPIDVVIRNNMIRHCALGTWLDWQAQGTRVSSNVYFENERDFMIEVTHGPCLVDNNIFASSHNIDNHAQGTAFIHNLFLGGWTHKAITNRFTPYHFPHSTIVLGTACVYGGDDRIYQNIFVESPQQPLINSSQGTANYNGSPTSEAEFMRMVHGDPNDPLIGDISLFERVKQPVFINSNAYFAGSASFDKEQSAFNSPVNPRIIVSISNDGSVWLEGDFPQELFNLPTRIIGTFDLGRPRISAEAYERPDGGAIKVDHDLLGHARSSKPIVGPLENLVPGHNRIRVA